MNDIKRYKLVATESSRNVIECDDGNWVRYSNIEQFESRIKQARIEALKSLLPHTKKIFQGSCEVVTVRDIELKIKELTDDK
ncbi:hypothetical protein RHO15_09795 [Utexia brackfieldae]|uniref:hypothetical protein n=1 Tax=Utexia brackfieldae TaxID=3074108 RepID=UPI00370D8400